jgi:hypothetical protein
MPMSGAATARGAMMVAEYGVLALILTALAIVGWCVFDD